MRLVWTEAGDPGEEPPVLLAHGLFGSGKNLGGLARRLAEPGTTIAIDVRGRRVPAEIVELPFYKRPS